MSQQPRHAFVVPAYGESPYLPACLASLSVQSTPSRIVVATSTPFDGIEALCEAHGAELHVHGPNRGIGHDWNTAIAQAAADWVTVAHQDDIYHPRFVERVGEAASAYPECAFVFTDADEVDAEGNPRAGGMNQRIKRMLVGSAFLGRHRIDGPWARRVLLGLGNSVNCPAVTLNMRLNPGFRFREDLRTNMDWMAWVDLTRKAGVARVPDALVSHRVHAESETARCLDDGARSQEDRMVFDALWPTLLSRPLQRLYALSYRGYMP